MINLRKMNKDDYYKIYKWCLNKEVYEWFEQRKLSYKEIEEKYNRKIKEQDIYIINYDNTDIGLVQIYKYKDNLDILKKYNNIYEFDIFIGENNYLNKGIGKYIVEYIKNLIYSKYNANYIILRPFKRNIRAIKCYKKCNFIEIYNYIDKNTIGNIEEIIVLINKKRG
ncbi:MAG: GNAT family N-acetyltransferase [Bacilli bacterium]|nr:GNAT family N-acetyltransferase [Bacilli bacterium]